MLTLELSPQQLHALLFPGCACTLDAERAHFIRRCPGNGASYTRVIPVDLIDALRPFITAEFFVLQEVNEDGLHYFVLWDKDDWEHSTERRIALRREFLERDVSHILQRAHAARQQRLTDTLFATKIFDRPKAEALARSLLSGSEESYAEKARKLTDMIRPIAANTNFSLYIPLTEIIKSVDARNVIPEERIHEIQSHEDTNPPRIEDPAGPRDSRVDEAGPNEAAPECEGTEAAREA